jgi:hypothetical protein
MRARPLAAIVVLLGTAFFAVSLTRVPDTSRRETHALARVVTTTSSSTTTTTVPPPLVTAAPRASRAAVRPRPRLTPSPVYAEIDGMPRLLRRIGGCESAGNPDAPINWAAQNRHSTASGGFQILNSTWAGWVKAYAPDLVGMYQRARDAPAADQLRVALAAFERQGPGAWNASRRCWG